MSAAEATTAEAVAALADEPLRNLVLLKQLIAYPQHVRAFRANSQAGSATMVTLDVAASAWDRHAYPCARLAVFIESDDPALTDALLPALPRGVGLIFKLSREEDAAAVATRFALARRTAFVSFTTQGGGERAADVAVTRAPGDDAYRLFAMQDHAREWLAPMLRAGNAFACVLERDGEAASVCFAFENFGQVWEVGGVVTAPAHRRRGLGVRVVRGALAELAARGLLPRYQVEESNTASIALARAVGLAPFLTITHYAYAG